MPEQFQAKESSNVAWARWDPETLELEIDFKNSKGEHSSTYRYPGFTPANWAEFQRAESKGKHFAYNIRPKFKGEKIPK